MKLSAVIMGHPKRLDFINDLSRQMPSVPVVLDRKNDRWDTGSRSLLAYEKDATHHLVVQDDAILCRDFLPACEVVAEVAGHHPVCLYIGKVRPFQREVSPAVKHVKEIGGAWLRMAGPWWGVAIIIPTRYIDELCHWGASRQHVANYDKRIAHFFKYKKVDCLYTVPSLVDHRPEVENPSLVNGRKGDRRAQYFIGHDKSPLTIDWDVPPTSLMVKFQSLRRPGEGRRVHVGGVNYIRMTRSKEWEQVASRV